MKDYIAQAIRTESPPTDNVKERSLLQIRAIHALMGMTTEVGELTDTFKKHIFYNNYLDGHAKNNIKEEIGDLFWYTALMCDVFGFTFEEIQEANIAKLRQRYPEKFTEYDAQNRDLEKERECLEVGSITITEVPAEQMTDRFVRLGFDETPVEQEGGRTAREKATNRQNTTQPGDVPPNLQAVDREYFVSLRKELNELRRFKKYVHLYLDKINIPKKEHIQPCRIQARLDWMVTDMMEEDVPIIDPKEYE